MTQRREIERHRQKLTEIRDIMDSMKTLAFMETHKLARYIQSQKMLVDNIENIAIDLLDFYPDILPQVEPATVIVLLIGSQRGFCGNFNELLFEHLQLTLDSHSKDKSIVVAVGQKLYPKLKNIPCNTIFLEGANVAEEINDVAGKIAQSLVSDKLQLLSLYVLHHADENNSIVSERLLPPFLHLYQKKQCFSHPPLLNMSPNDFLLELTESYLFASLHRILYASLMAENQNRVRHLENAVEHLDNKENELIHKVNSLRQEEIIEEIEVILLNASIS